MSVTMEMFSVQASAEKLLIHILGEHFIKNIDHYDRNRADREGTIDRFNQAAFLVGSNLKTIHDVGESPAERAFFSALQYTAAWLNPFSLIFEGPTKDILGAIKARRDAARPRLLTDPYSPIIVTLQPSVKGERFRLDSLAWRESDGSPLVAIEVDGFKHHGTAERFSADRKRDRTMNRLGVETLRYSGAEIFHEPIKSGAEIYLALVYKLLIVRR